MRHKIKYPDGGSTDKSVYVNTNYQSAGSLGAALQDPYSFSKSMGVTTLTPEQWKKLGADQAQVIWREAFQKAGFVQIGENSWKAPSGQTNQFAMGGNTQYDAITGALSPMIGMIPGGQFINMGLDLIGNFIPKKEEPKPYTGVYSMGGRAKYSKYEVEGNEVALGSDIQLEGSSDESSFGKIARGASHANGGVDGVGAGFILSDRIGLDGSVKPNNENSIAAHARPIMKALSKMEKRRDDAISRMGKNILSDKLNVLKDFNEKMLSLQSQEKKKFFEGGLTYPWEEESTGTGYANDLQTGTPTLTEDPSTMYQETGDNLGVNLVNPTSYSTIGTAQPAAQSKVGGMNMLTAAGMGISGLGALGQIINTVKEHRQNEAENPEQNFYEDISARAERTYGESLSKMNAMKMKSARDINDAYGSVLSNQGADSINVDRAMKNVMYSQRAKGIADSNLNYDAAIADRKIGLSNLQLQGDMAQAEGRTNTLMNKQQNLANYFTNLGANISDATGQALNAVKIAQNAKTQTQALMLLKDAYPNFSLSELNGMLQIILK